MAKGFSYNINLGADVSVLEQKLAAAKKILNDTFGEGSVPKGMQKALEVIESKVDSIKTKSSTPAKSSGVFTSMENDAHAIERALEQLDREIDGFNKKTTKEKFKLLPDNEQKKVSAAINALEKLKSAAERVKAAVDKEAEAQTKLDDLRKRSDAVKESRDAVKAKMDEIKANKELYESIKAQVEERKKAAEAEGKTYNPSKANFDDGKGGKINGGKAIAALEEYAKLEQELKILNGSYGSLQGQISRTSNSMAAAQTAIANSKTAFGEARAEAEKLGISLDGVGTEGTQSDIEALNNAIEQQMQTALVSANEGMSQLSNTTKDLNTSVQTTTASIRQQNQAFTEQNQTAGEVTGLMSRIKQFTGLTGAAILMRKALHNAFSTIKELDKQMTEMAVVTDLGVGDYWKQLPEHTARANELGMAIKDVYQAETLYYQQGLKSAEVTQLSTSTLKMARIAGLSAEDATNKMTAALRGFNMEINETNADRIADVYSKLAAITASNVQEISTAMTKTASIAANAGMEFETTAAFLSQIIETTRESAETAGTALKTVIARFQELKKSPDEIGEVDGEIIDANKIETALRSVGVALRDAQGQFRNLDDVFMELSGKWDSLDMNTQRYIATIAAGSRQQSRFVAMMSNYSRTQELVSAANNAAGASNEQFEKTLESLESKLAALKNAWDSFTMGLMNSSLIKMAIDILTGVLNTVNAITDAFGEWPGTALKIGLVVTALSVGDKALKAFMASMKLGNGVLASLGAGIKAPFSAAANSIRKLANTTLMYNKEVFKTKLGVSTAMKADAAYMKVIKAESTAKANNIKGTQENKIAEQQLTKAKRDAALAQQNLAIQMGWYNTTTKQATVQGAVYNKLVSAGIAPSEAAALAAQTNAEATEEEAMAEAISIGQKTGLIALKGTEATLENIDTEATKKNTIEKQQNNLANSGGIIGLLMRLGLRILGKKATDEDTKSEGKNTLAKGSNTIATLMQAAANGTLLATMWPILVATLAIAAAVLILVGLFLLLKALFKAIHDASPEGKFEAASEALEHASEAADAAKEAYNGLKDALSGLDDKYKALDELTVGTREWRDAMLEVNNEVMDLIDQYPELANAVEVDANGVMRLNEERKQEVLDEKQAVAARAQAAKLQAKLNKNEAEANLKYSKLSDKAVSGNQAADTWKGIGMGAATGAAMGGSQAGVYGAGIGAVYGAVAGGVMGHELSRAMNAEATSKFAEAYASGQFGTGAAMDRSAAAAWMKEEFGENFDVEGWLDELDQGALDELREYGQILNKNTAEQRAAMQSMIANATALIDTNKYTAEQLQQMNNIGTEAMSNQIKNSTNEVLSQTADTYKRNAEEYFGNLGKDVKVGKDGSVKYTDADGNEVKLTKEQAAAQMGAANATDEMAKRMEALPKALAGVGNSLRATGKAAKDAESAQKALNKAFNDDQGQALSRTDLAQLSKDAVEQMWQNNQDLQDAYPDFQEFLNEMGTRTKLANQAFKQNAAELKRIGLQYLTLDQTLSADAEKGLIKGLKQVVAVSGVEAAQELNDSITSLLMTVSEEDRDKLAAQLNAIDWHDASALEALPQTLKNVGLNVPLDELQSFISKTKDLAQAVHNVDFSKINESIRNLEKISQSLKQGITTRTFEEEQYNALITVDPSLKKYFTQDLEGNYMYLGSSIERLIIAINNNTNALLQEGATNYQNQLNAAGILKDMASDQTLAIGQDLSGNILAAIHYAEEDQRAFLQEFLDIAEAQDIDLSGIHTLLSNDTDVSAEGPLTREDVQSIMSSLRALVGNETEIRNDMLTEGARAVAASLADDNIYKTTEHLDKVSETDETAIMNHRGGRQNVLSYAIAQGVSEPELKRLTEYHDLLIRLEEAEATNTDEYKNLRDAFNEYSKQIAKTAGYQVMLKGTQANIDKLNELVESYKQAGSAEQKRFLASQMVANLGIEATESNYEYIASLTNEFLQGSEAAYGELINLAAANLGIAADEWLNFHDKAYNSAYDLLNAGLTMAELAGTAWEDLATQLIETNQAWVDEVTGQFHLGTKEALNYAKNTVEQVKYWLNPYGWLYNLNELVNSKIRQREDLEWKYQRALSSSNATAAELLENIKAQVDATKAEMLLEEQRYANARQSIDNLIDGAPDAFKAFINMGANGQLSIDFQGLYGQKWTEDMGAPFEEWIGKLEEVRDELAASIDNLKSIRDRIAQQKYTGRDEYNDLVGQIRDALSARYQKEIDVLSNINDAVTEAASAVVSKLQEKIDDDRKAREDDKALQNLEDKQARLAYLQASGGSQLDILKLQKEIDDDTEAYQDKLVDDTIAAMEKANDQAADQRQQQINIAQAQLDYWNDNDATAAAEAQLKEWLSHGTNFATTQITNLLSETTGRNLTTAEWKQWESDTSTAVSQAEIWRDQTAFTYYDNLEKEIDAEIDQRTKWYEELDKGNQAVKNQVDTNTNTINGNISDTKAVALDNAKQLEVIKTEWAEAKKAYIDAANKQIDAAKDQLEAAKAQKEAAAAAKKAADDAEKKQQEDRKIEKASSFKGLDSNYITKNSAAYGKSHKVSDDALTSALDYASTSLGKGNILTSDEGNTVYQKVNGSWVAYNKKADEPDPSTEIKTKTYNPNVPEVIEGAGIQGYGEGFLWSDKNRSTNDIDVTIDGKTYDLLLGNTAPTTIQEALNKAITTKKAAETLVLFRNLLFLYGKDKLWHQMESDHDLIANAVWGAKTLKGYLTGGLADFTGPAWLDGTKSAPELVLNATDTANFIALKDILSEIMRGAHSNSTDKSTGNNYYDINVHVDSIESDYDVDQAVDRMRELIEEDAMYRNVTAINKTR